MKNSNSHVGSSLDDFLAEENLLVEANEMAIKRVIAWQLQQEIESKNMTKTIVARAMGTSWAAVDRFMKMALLTLTRWHQFFNDTHIFILQQVPTTTAITPEVMISIQSIHNSHNHLPVFLCLIC
jgi:predicted XRE-type DNA-binding protein